MFWPRNWEQLLISNILVMPLYQQLWSASFPPSMRDPMSLVSIDMYLPRKSMTTDYFVIRASGVSTLKPHFPPNVNLPELTIHWCVSIFLINGWYLLHNFRLWRFQFSTFTLSHNAFSWSPQIPTTCPTQINDSSLLQDFGTFYQDQIDEPWHPFWSMIEIHFGASMLSLSAFL